MSNLAQRIIAGVDKVNVALFWTFLRTLAGSLLVQSSAKLALAHRGPNASLNSSHNSTASMNDCAPKCHLVDVKCGESGPKIEGAEQTLRQGRLFWGMLGTYPALKLGRVLRSSLGLQRGAGVVDINPIPPTLHD